MHCILGMHTGILWMHTGLKSTLYHMTNSATPPRSSTWRTKQVHLRSKSIEIIPSQSALEVTWCHDPVHVRKKRIETQDQTSILSCCNQLGKKVSDHLLSYAKDHIQVSHADATPHQVITDLQMSNIPQSCRIRRDVKTGLRIRIEAIGLWAIETKETHHVLCV